MYRNDQGNFTDIQVGKVYKILMFMKEIPNVDVFLDKSAEVRVKYDGGHQHFSFQIDEYEHILDELKSIIKMQHSENLKKIHVAFTEDVKLSGISTSEYMEKHGTNKTMSIISRKTWTNYVEKIEEVLAA